jgi:hypothetical protein
MSWSGQTGPPSGGTTCRQAALLFGATSAAGAGSGCFGGSEPVLGCFFGSGRGGRRPRSSGRGDPVGCTVSRERAVQVGGSPPRGGADGLNDTVRPSGRVRSTSMDRVPSGARTGDGLWRASSGMRTSGVWKGVLFGGCLTKRPDQIGSSFRGADDTSPTVVSSSEEAAPRGPRVAGRGNPGLRSIRSGRSRAQHSFGGAAVLPRESALCVRRALVLFGTPVLLWSA